jgi:hypothetical protein
MNRGDSANPDIKTQVGLSESEREALIERARYEVFKEHGNNSRMVLRSVFTFIILGTLLAALALTLVPLLPDNFAAKLFFTALLAGAGGIAGYWNSRQRSKLINEKIQELTNDS